MVLTQNELEIYETERKVSNSVYHWEKETRRKMKSSTEEQKCKIENGVIAFK